MKNIIVLFVLLLISCKTTQEVKINNEQLSNHHLKKLSFLPTEIIEASVAYLSPTFKSNNNQILSYELSVLNNYRIPFKLKKVKIYDVNKPDILFAEFDSIYLKNHFKRKGISKNEDLLLLQGNQFGVVNFMLNLGENKKAPKQIFHKLILENTAKNGKTRTIPMEVAIIPIPNPTSLELALPFKKGKWVYGAKSHRDTQFLTEGKATYPQRFAIDWVLIDKDGYFAKNDISNNKNWATYGVDLLAVANGTVIDIKDGIIENNPTEEKMAVKITRETIAGNYIALDIGNNITAVYAHLIPNSLKVKVGDVVKKGQIIGLLGNSGNSDAPHLHFHLETKSKITLAGEGVPYYFANYNLLASYTDDEFERYIDKKQVPLNNLKINKQENELPIGNGLIEF